VSEHLRVNPILCDAHGHCAELFPELVTLDEWGYPIIEDGPIPPELAKEARRAVSMCPRLALMIEQRDARAPDQDLQRPGPAAPPRTG
jgi:ferredoxin